MDRSDLGCDKETMLLTDQENNEELLVGEFSPLSNNEEGDNNGTVATVTHSVHKDSWDTPDSR